MKNLLRILGAIITIISMIVIGLVYSVEVPTAVTQLILILFGFLLTLAVPGLLIDIILTGIGLEIGENDMKCGGIPSGGYLIGYSERSLIFLSFLINYFDAALSYASILSFLSVIVAGKAIFRYSSKETDDRSCADWYILGTLMSITMALALSWGLFRFLLVE